MSETIQKHSRMPRKYSRRTLRRREQEAKGDMTKLYGVDAVALVARYQAGHKIRDIALEYGVSNIAVYAHLLKFAPDEWMAAQKAKAFAMKEGGEDGLDDAVDPLEVAVAREKLRAGQWDLERVDRKNYGRDDHNINITMIDLGDRLRRARERVGQVIEPEIGGEPSLEHRAPASLSAARSADQISPDLSKPLSE